jgi:hypothetical protein
MGRYCTHTLLYSYSTVLILYCTHTGDGQVDKVLVSRVELQQLRENSSTQLREEGEAAVGVEEGEEAGKAERGVPRWPPVQNGSGRTQQSRSQCSVKYDRSVQ